MLESRGRAGAARDTGAPERLRPGLSASFPQPFGPWPPRTAHLGPGDFCPFSNSDSSFQSGQFNEDMIPTVGFNMRKITKGNVTIKVRSRAGPWAQAHGRRGCVCACARVRVCLYVSGLRRRSWRKAEAWVRPDSWGKSSGRLRRQGRRERRNSGGAGGGHVGTRMDWGPACC